MGDGLGSREKIMKMEATVIQPLVVEIRRMLAPMNKRRRILVAVSGGADSVSLLHLLLEAGYKNLVVAHFNHHLRGADSKADALFVARLAKKLHLTCELGSGEVQKMAQEKKGSLETVARDMRYAFFAATAKIHRIRSLIIAHHADDQVETCFFQFLRGSGAAGLAGMKPLSHRMIHGVRLDLYRPLLSISKKQLLDYLKERRLRYREDHTNAIPEASRNKLRLQVLPLIEGLLGASFRGSILRNARIFFDEEDFLSSLTHPMAAQAELSVTMLRQLHPALLRRVLHAWLKNYGILEPGLAAVERTASLLELSEKAPAKINLSGNHHARRRAGIIFLEKGI
jgi:tRNA(Ile)-lysidine synthase